VLKTQSTTSRQNKSSSIECLDAYDIDDEGFIDGNIITGKVLTTFNFGMNGTSVAEVPIENQTDKSPGIQNQTYTSMPRGLTPPINGEHYTVKRSYSMRPSTVRKLNALKAEHPDVNILFNTIVDMAISHYYNYIFTEGGNFDFEEEKKETS
jgi:hypothetical protein